LARPFDSSGCAYFGATYRPHPAWYGADPRYTYTLTLGPPGKPFFEHAMLFQVRETRTGTPVMTLRLHHSVSNGLVRETVSSTGSEPQISVEMRSLNRDLSPGALGGFCAPYAIMLTSLTHALYYGGEHWERLVRDGDATFHRSGEEKILFPDLWLLATCGREGGSK
jgi:hypothetical protein